VNKIGNRIIMNKIRIERQLEKKHFLPEKRTEATKVTEFRTPRMSKQFLKNIFISFSYPNLC
jgi:hypothetical protein